MFNKNGYIIPEKNIVPKKWQGLSGRVVDKLIKENMFNGVLQPYSFVNAIEQALKEKNT